MFLDESTLSEQIFNNISDESSLAGQELNFVSGQIHPIGTGNQ
jgi:hypothetical protein